MKKVTKFFMAALLAGICNFGYAQDYLGNPKSNEKVIGTISVQRYTDSQGSTNDWATKLQWYQNLLQEAKQQYPNKNIDIRQMEVGQCYGSGWPEGFHQPAVGKVVWVMSKEDIMDEFNKTLSQAINKALRNVREGSRLAIDQVTVPYSMDKEDLKDQLLDILLNKGYRIVAKDYLDKLYEEQQSQQSGIYNEGTTVQENNFSAVGYYINVKVTETSLRVQVVNVSTGEYEGNATVNF